MKGFATKAIHGSTLKKDVHGALRTPLYENVAFEFENSRALQLAFEGRLPAHSYSRISNPTVEELEQRVRLLTDATGVVAVSSGMAAITNVMLVLAEAGANIIASRYLFGNTYSLFEHTLKPWGLDVRYTDMTRSDSLLPLIDERTRAIFLETITNPQLEVADIAAVATIAASAGIPVVLDGTVTTPYLFPSKDYGVAVEVLSSTKYISGGATTVGGLIIDNGTYDWKQSPRLRNAAAQYGPFALVALLRREAYRNLGACMAPHNAHAQSLGLETLGLRIEKSCANAVAIARFLETCPAVRSVNYPGLASSPAHETAKRQFGNRFGGILTFELADQPACFKFMDSLSLIKRATNINDNKTLILHPASTIFCEYSETEKAELGVSPCMVRLAAGIEDIEDILDDLREGLKLR